MAQQQMKGRQKKGITQRLIALWHSLLESVAQEVVSNPLSSWLSSMIRSSLMNFTPTHTHILSTETSLPIYLLYLGHWRRLSEDQKRSRSIGALGTLREVCVWIQEAL